MANSWKKITDKIDEAPMGSASPADWQAMNAGIEAHPELNKARGGSLWWKVGVGLLIVALAGLGLWMSLGSEADFPSPAISTHEAQRDELPQVDKASKTKIEKTLSDNIAEHQSEKPSEESNSAATPEKLTLEKQAGSDEADSYKNDNSKRAVVEPQKENITKVESTSSSLTNVGQDIALEMGEQPERSSIHNISDADASSAANIDDAQESSPKEATLQVEGARVDENFEIADNELEHVPQTFVANNEEKESSRSEEPLTTAQDDNAKAENPEEVNEISSSGESESQTSAAVEPINLRSGGFRLSSLNVGAGYHTDFSGNMHAPGIGVDVDIQRGGLLINTGLAFYQLNALTKFVSHATSTAYDTTYSTAWDTTVVITRDSAWVIDSAWVGHWADKSDTTISISSRTDTLTDTTTTQLRTEEERRIKLSYMEMPILAGHRFRFNRFAIDLHGGVVLSQLLTATVEGKNIDEKFGLDMVLRPALRYYIKPRWSVFGRAGLRYSVIKNEYRPQNLYSNFQLGLTYHW